MSIYEVAENLGKAYPKAFTPENIISGFRCTGVCPFNDQIFTDDDFMGSYVTDRLVPTQSLGDGPSGLPQAPGQSDDPARLSNANQSDTASSCKGYISPQEVRPYPKAPPRKGTKGGRKKGKTVILTDTPVKDHLAEEAKQREGRKRKKPRRRLHKTKQADDADTDEDEIEEPMVLADDTDSPDEENEDFPSSEFTFNDIKLTDYVLVKYLQGRAKKFFVGKVIAKHGKSSFKITFLVKQRSREVPLFAFPDKEDSDTISFEDIVARLPNPEATGGTKRAAKLLKFSYDLKQFF